MKRNENDQAEQDFQNRSSLRERKKHWNQVEVFLPRQSTVTNFKEMHTYHIPSKTLSFKNQHLTRRCLKRNTTWSSSSRIFISTVSAIWSTCTFRTCVGFLCGISWIKFIFREVIMCWRKRMRNYATLSSLVWVVNFNYLFCWRKWMRNYPTLFSCLLKRS